MLWAVNLASTNLKVKKTGRSVSIHKLKLELACHIGRYFTKQE